MTSEELIKSFKEIKSIKVLDIKTEKWITEKEKNNKTYLVKFVNKLSNWEYLMIVNLSLKNCWSFKAK